MGKRVFMFPGQGSQYVGMGKGYIDKYSALPDVKAWKMPGAGGGGYLALVVDDVKKFAEAHPEAITLTIRRK